jgi:hypothetical protein
VSCGRAGDHDLARWVEWETHAVAREPEIREQDAPQREFTQDIASSEFLIVTATSAF